MRNVNFYVVYSEKAKSKDGISVEFVSYAWNENHVREMAEEQGVDLDGYTIECMREDVRDQLRRPVEPSFRPE